MGMRQMTDQENYLRPLFRKLIEVPIALRWRDLDALNHVNNASFLTYVEEARLQWFATFSAPWCGTDYMPVLAAVHFNYRAQVSWPGSLVVELYCERLGNSSLTIAHRIVDGADRARVYCDGNNVMVWVDPASGKPIVLPDVIRNACA